MCDPFLENTNIVQDDTNVNLDDDEVPAHIQQMHDIIENIPTVGLKFDSEAELFAFYQKYAYKCGFGVRKSSTKIRDSATYYALGCANGSVYVPKSNTKRVCRTTSKTDCKAKVCVIVYGDGRCIISQVFLEHNHELSPKKARFHRSHKKMDSYSKRRLDQCRSIQGAVAQIFPESHHRLCLWHIMKKVPEKLGGLEQYKAIKKTLKSLVYESVECQEFDDGWSKMIEDYSLEKNEWLCSLFKDRRRWVPAFVKDIFWAGMSTTQRSESMNSFFDGYVNSKTSLRQFVEQYDNALKSKIEKETKADFESLNSSYMMITRFNFERQFHDTYTNAIFKLFQDELRGIMCCNSSLFQIDGTISTFHVTDVVYKKYGDFNRRVVYTVCYNADGSDIKCSCRLFEFRGIVCRHMVKILIEMDINEIHPRYILSRWRKDVKHRPYFVINCYDDLKSGEKSKQFDHLCANFYEAAHIANSQEKYEYLINCINMAKEKLNDVSSWGVTSNINATSENVHHVPGSTRRRMLPPLKVRGRGRPPYKRKKDIIEKVSSKKKKINSSSMGVKKTTSNKQILSSSIGMTKTTSHEQQTNSSNIDSCKFQFDLNQNGDPY